MKWETYEYVVCSSEELYSTVTNCKAGGWEVIEQNYIGNDLWEIIITR
jgi:hypothetical protein